MAGYCRLMRSNLCTRHIQKKLTRGHHDWPDKATRRTGGFPQLPTTGLRDNFPHWALSETIALIIVAIDPSSNTSKPTTRLTLVPRCSAPALIRGWNRLFVCYYFSLRARSMRTISEFSRSRSNTIFLPSGVMSKVRIAAVLKSS